MARMTRPGAADVEAIRDLVARHPHVLDNHAWDALPHAYTGDAGLGGEQGELAPVAGLGGSLTPDRV
ncbi:MAG: nuclear transport factor 2 family protein, partial [Aeromicrobium sp.]